MDSVEEIVRHLADFGISVVLDLHQDLFARPFCGEGVPDYMVETCKKYAPEGMKPFPAPVRNMDNTTDIPLDDNGNPSLDWCLETAFFKYYLSEEVSAMFQCLYDNREGLWDALGGYWQKVASRFSSHHTVLGYELINEPWLGDIYSDKSLLLPKQTESRYLAPMYEHVSNMIRQVDDEKIIFFEGVTIDYWPSGFDSVPGGPDYATRTALAYHVYCPLQEPKLGQELACRAIDRDYMHMRQKDAERLNTGLMMTEFGAMTESLWDMQEMEKQLQLADEFMTSWMYWQFKQYEDITTMTPQGESLYSKEHGLHKLSTRKIKTLSRTYPQTVSGTLESFSFDSKTSLFSMTYKPWRQKDVPEGTVIDSVVYFNLEQHYPKGIKATFRLDDGTEVPRDANELGDLTASVVELWTYNDDMTYGHLSLVYTGNTPSTLIVDIEPCTGVVDIMCHCVPK